MKDVIVNHWDFDTIKRFQILALNSSAQIKRSMLVLSTATKYTYNVAYLFFAYEFNTGWKLIVVWKF